MRTLFKPLDLVAEDYEGRWDSLISLEDDGRERLRSRRRRRYWRRLRVACSLPVLPTSHVSTISLTLAKAGFPPKPDRLRRPGSEDAQPPSREGRAWRESGRLKSDDLVETSILLNSQTSQINSSSMPVGCAYATRSVNKVRAPQGSVYEQCRSRVEHTELLNKC